LAFEPFGGRFFEFFDRLGDSDGAGKAMEDVNMILDRVDEDEGAIEGFTDLTEVGMEGGADGVGEERMSIFGREDQMNVNVGEGLGHWRGIPSRISRFKPVTRNIIR